MSVPSMTRRQRIVVLLETFRDVLEGFGGEWGAPSGTRGDRLLLLSAEWHEGSYRELDRCLHELKRRYPILHAHVRDRYLGAERRTARLTKRSGRWLGLGENERIVGEPVLLLHGAGEYRALVESWEPHVDPRLVRRGVDLLDRWFGCDPQVPATVLGFDDGTGGSRTKAEPVQDTSPDEEAQAWIAARRQRGDDGMTDRMIEELGATHARDDAAAVYEQHLDDDIDWARVDRWIFQRYGGMTALVRIKRRAAKLHACQGGVL